MTSPQSRNTTAPTDSTTTANTAAVFDQLQRGVAELKAEALPSDQNVVGRDTAQIRSLLDRNFGYLRQLAQLMGIAWTPSGSDQAA